ncbi:response regulator [Alteromonas oceanisediminis]|uniref:response regulator n=1 Tax=Alteromonas oceanisediminis TaxID=2836180 RepID=UPI001BDA4F42|nr:response regulator [Alteromonas oceanisediminis]MBT0585268.1 response regulator [Alteromonas oceanisediminis]
MKNINILVVDDDVVTLELVTLVLADYTEGQVHTFTKSTDAIRAIEEAGAFEYQLVISDLMMPEKDGLDVLAALNGAVLDAKFLMLTGNATREKVLEARKLGADAFIAKPFATQDLLDKLDDIVD